MRSFGSVSRSAFRAARSGWPPAWTSEDSINVCALERVDEDGQRDLDSAASGTGKIELTSDGIGAKQKEEDLAMFAKMEAEDKAALADDVLYQLPDEKRIARQFKCLAAVRLQAECRPHSADRGVRKASFRSHGAD